MPVRGGETIYGTGPHDDDLPGSFPGKIVPREEAAALGERLRRCGQKVVFTNGCFDILHAGHVRYLAAARRLGDCLVVGLNSDASVRRLKGPDRPLNSEADRAEVLAALAAVDFVVIFGEDTGQQMVEDLKPDIYVKGGDYQLEDLPEARAAAAYGGRTVIIPLLPGRSTSRIIARARASGEKWDV